MTVTATTVSLTMITTALAELHGVEAARPLGYDSIDRPSAPTMPERDEAAAANRRAPPSLLLLPPPPGPRPRPAALPDARVTVDSLSEILTAQVRNIALVSTAIANGDLSQKITVETRGEVLAQARRWFGSSDE